MMLFSKISSKIEDKFSSFVNLKKENKNLVCPLCQGTEFDKQEGKMDSKWGITTHKITLRICKNRRLILSFSKGRTIFDFD